MLSRSDLTEALDALEDFPCVGILGARQIGKTTLAHQIAEKSNSEYVYLDLESPSDFEKLNQAEQFLTSVQDKLVIIDEIHRRKELFPLLRSLIDKNRRPGRFIILGSASPEVIRDSSESLAGRIAYIPLGGINIVEIGFDQMRDHWLYGGFPQPLLTIKNKQRWFANYITTYIERDLPMLGLPASPVETRRLWSMLSHFHGETLNYSALSKSLELTDKTVKSYIDFLDQAFMIRQLQPFHTNIKKRLVKSPKVYFRDSGLYHHFVGIKSFQDLIGHPKMGHSWEGYVVEQIQQLKNSDHDLYFYRTQQGAEVDLVIVKNSKPVAVIEIKHGDQVLPSRGNEVSAEDLEVKNRFIVHSKNSESDWTAKGDWKICSLQSFVEKHLSGI